MGILFTAVSPATSAPAFDRFYHQQLAWKPCGDKDLDAAGADCADVLVPLDYRDPSGASFTIAISRLKATDPAERRGILLTNPGGPGEHALNFNLTVGKRVLPAVRARYDLIGFDPRGIGRSAPVKCLVTLPSPVFAAGFDAASYARDVAVQAGVAASCLVPEASRIRHLTTRNTARDLDVIRAALGESKLNYYGASYGTYLGAVYMQLFGANVDRIVLDSSLDPDRYWIGTFADMGAVNEAGLDDWAGWAAQRDTTFHLGTTAGQVRASVEDLLHRVARRPVPFAGNSVDEHVLPVLLFTMLPNPTNNDLLATTVRELIDLADGKSVQIDHRIVDSLKLQSALSASSFTAITCGDVAAPRDPGWYWGNIERSRATQPIFGPMVNNISPCAYWPAPVEPPTVVRNAVPVLMLQATRDPRTAYPEGLAMHRDLTGSRLITLWDYRIHGALRVGLSSCLTNAVDRYLVNGRMPSADLICKVG